MANQEPADAGQIDNPIDRGQVSSSAAQVYDEFFVPALFNEWTGRMVEAAHIGTGQRVLDVACGTGILAQAAAERVGPAGFVAGVDINAGMLEVASRKAPGIDWRLGQAESLPYADGSFEAVVSQFGLMFFVDQPKAIQEMYRVLRSEGRMAVAVWDALENSPGYAALAKLLQQLFGDWAAEALQAPFNLGDPERLRTLFDAAGVSDARIHIYTGTARFPSLDAWIFTEVKGWTLADKIDDMQFERLLSDARHKLYPFVLDDGSVAFKTPAHVVTVTK